eukprot:3933955-Rhodomonas_salina.1
MAYAVLRKGMVEGGVSYHTLLTLLSWYMVLVYGAAGHAVLSQGMVIGGTAEGGVSPPPRLPQ